MVSHVSSVEPNDMLPLTNTEELMMGLGTRPYENRKTAEELKRDRTSVDEFT